MFRTLPLVLVALWISANLSAQEKDSRLGKPKDYNSYFPWTPPTSKEQWEKRRRQVKEQLLVANGMWPLPDKTPLNAVIHGKIERDGYTIEKVFFASYPGHYVTGNLYRPTGKAGKIPGILCPHGHWGDRSSPATNGRFYQAPDAAVASQLKNGAEKTKEGALFPLQARCAQLARMGCVVFHYDMVGYGDSTQIYHPLSKQDKRGVFSDLEAELRLQGFMGLQTWNSVRALDFVMGLPEVDPSRIGVTGASGGGTQTFILCAVDERPAVAVPAVMVSTGMQGGCICENTTYLRVGTGNIELAGLFAPKPLGLIGADDWTIKIESDGYPQLQALYRLFNAAENVQAKAFTQFKHNYNQVSREFMYNFFNKHLKLGHKEPVLEQPFQPVPPKELSVFDAAHPLPKDAADGQALRQYLTRESNRQLHALFPRNAQSLTEMQRIIGPALQAMITDTLPPPSEVVEVAKGDRGEKNGILSRTYVIGRKGQGEAIPAVGLRGKEFDGTVVVWIHPDGLKSIWLGDDKDKLVPEAQQILDKKAAILAVDVFGTGSLKGAIPLHKTYLGYTFGYNRSLLANRVHDILTAVAFAQGYPQAKKVSLVGLDQAGPWVVLARGLCGDAVARTAADLNQFRFENILSSEDEMLLPGALKYGGLPTLSALCAPHQLLLHNAKETNVGPWLEAAYQISSNQAALNLQDGKTSTEKVVAWLLR